MLVLVGNVEPGDHVAVAEAWLPVRAVQAHRRDGGHGWERAVRLVFGSWVRLTYGAEETVVVRRYDPPPLTYGAEQSLVVRRPGGPWTRRCDDR
jgi:hypothetical protein